MGFESFAISFVLNVGANYLISRAMAKDGPRLKDLAAGGGEYGVGMPRLYGENVRLAPVFLAQADIKETKHKVEDHSELIGAGVGLIGGVIGAAIGGFLGAITPNQYYYTYSDTFDQMVADRFGDVPIEGVSKIWAAGKVIFNAAGANVISESLDGDGRLIFRKYGKNRFFKSLTVYGGHTDQPIDPIMSSLLGEVSGLPFTAHFVIEDLQLADFGNGVPQIEALVKVATGQTFAAVAEAICGFSGIDPLRDLSTTALAENILRGYGLLNETTCWDALKPLLPVFGADAAEVAGQIRFYKRSQTMRATIPLKDMGAHIYGDGPPDKFTLARNTDLSLPQETSITFIDLARDYQANSASSRRSEGNASSNISVTLPLVLTAGEGASAAALMHWDAWLGRSQITFALTDAWISLDVGLAYAIPVADQFVPYRITRAARGANGIHEIEALSDESVTYTASITGSSGTLPDEDPTEFADTRLVLIDGAILDDGHDDYGFYVAMGGSESYWERGAVQISAAGTTYATLIDSPLNAVMGDVTGTLAAGTTDGLDDTLDTTTVLTVVLLHDDMELASVTDAQLDGFANFAFVGKDGVGEFLQFKTATFISGSTWQLTNLRRGRKGSDWAIATHASGEEFALLDSGLFRIVYTAPDDWGDDVFLRGVTLHQDEADADVIEFTNTGEGKRPYSPVNVQGDWDGSDNVDITWDARSRLNAGGLGIDDQNNFEVEITSGTGRTLTATGVSTVTYTAAQQTTDTLTPGDTFSGRVRQLSDVNNGRWRNFSIAGPNDYLELEDDVTPIHLEDGSTILETE